MSLKLHVEDVLWNFDTIGGVDNHQTLTVSGDKLGFDDRYLQSVRRTFTGDSRESVMETIKTTFDRADEILKAYQCNYYIQPNTPHIHQEQIEIVKEMQNHVKEIHDRCDPLSNGLDRLSTFERYINDSSIQTKISRLKKRVQQLRSKCQHLSEKILARLRLITSNHDTCCYQMVGLKGLHAHPSLSQASPTVMGLPGPKLKSLDILQVSNENKHKEPCDVDPLIKHQTPSLEDTEKKCL